MGIPAGLDVVEEVLPPAGEVEGPVSPVEGTMDPPPPPMPVAGIPPDVMLVSTM